MAEAKAEVKQETPEAIPAVNDKMTEGEKRRAIARAKRYAEQA